MPIKGEVFKDDWWENENKVQFTVWLPMIPTVDTVSVMVLEASEVEEVVKLLHSISFPLDEWPKLKKALAILEGE